MRSLFLSPRVFHEVKVGLERFRRSFLHANHVGVLAQQILTHERLAEGPNPVLFGNMRLVALRRGEISGIPEHGYIQQEGTQGDRRFKILNWIGFPDGGWWPFSKTENNEDSNRGLQQQNPLSGLSQRHCTYAMAPLLCVRSLRVSQHAHSLCESKVTCTKGDNIPRSVGTASRPYPTPVFGA